MKHSVFHLAKPRENSTLSQTSLQRLRGGRKVLHFLIPRSLPKLTVPPCTWTLGQLTVKNLVVGAFRSSLWSEPSLGRAPLMFRSVIHFRLMPGHRAINSKPGAAPIYMFDALQERSGLHSNLWALIRLEEKAYPSNTILRAVLNL